MTKAAYVALCLLEADEIMGPEGSPVPFYRGQRKFPKPGKFVTRQGRSTPSFSTNPHLASVFAATRDWTGQPKYELGANVAKYRMKMKNPVDLRGLGTHTTLWDAISRLKCDFSDNPSNDAFSWDDLSNLIDDFDQRLSKLEYKVKFTTSFDPVCAVTNWEDLGDQVMDIGEMHEDPTAIESNRMAELESLIEGVEIDTYAVADNPSYVRAAKRQGYDGIIHRDTFEAGAEHLHSLTGKTPEEVTDLDLEDDHGFDTYRPFSDLNAVPYHWKEGQPWPPAS